MIKITYKTLRGWEDSEEPGWAEVDSLSESVLVDDRSIDVATANAGGPSQAFLLCRSGRVACGGAYTAFHSLGEVGALLVEHGKGANLPPASQGFAVIETATAAPPGDAVCDLRRPGPRGRGPDLALCGWGVVK